MYIYVRVIAIISIMSSIVTHPQYGPSCAQIKHGTRPESFVQRITCARQAVLGGNTAAAYELMAPIYRDARNTTSNTRPDSQAKLNTIVELQLPDTGRQLIKQYGIDDVYTALAQTVNIDPASGSTVASKRTLAQPLVTSVTNALQSARSSKPAARPIEKTEEPTQQPRELTAEEKDMVVKAQRQVAKAFALNNMVDNIFFIAVKNNNSDVCQNLISAIKQADDRNVQAIVDIVALYHKQGDNAQTAYANLTSKLASYKIVQWLGFGNKDKTTQELLDLWIDAAPSLKLLNALEKSGMPTEEQEGYAGACLFRLNEGTNELRVSKAIMLMRNAKSLMFEPDGQKIKTPTPLMAFGNVDALYQALYTGLIDNNFIIEPDTQFMVQGKKLTLNEIDTQLAQIIADEAIRVMMEMEELKRQGYAPAS